jgi:phage shock protein A
MEENATAKMRTETENGKGVHLDEAALQRMEELQREMEKEISLRNGAELTLKAYLKKIQEVCARR